MALTRLDAAIPNCPSCGGRMWDNRLSKRNPRAPDFKCRDRSCDGVIWPARNGDDPSSEEERGATSPSAIHGGAETHSAELERDRPVGTTATVPDESTHAGDGGALPF